ncbi:DsbA family protein [Calothrix sp. PCC 7507]|uniref:DsbA family protein n=1 Tax=Calothrix sp. PCC 7507 TaxID=99598 RepID=UPI00029F44D6|nr:DsbA family protein [Calothrix sp. PCC 7507]AFY34055.1 DSBA oxidoreductase [Calothrix sp. PCC 7507]
MSQTNDNNRLIAPISERDHTQGAIDAPIVLVEYGNYQCPHSGEAHRIIPQIQKELGNKLYFAFRHFPQPQIYPQSYKTAEAAEIAAAQGKFWQMHNTLFECQTALSNGYLVEYAHQLGLNVPQFLRDMTNHIYVDQVAEDFQSGTNSGVNSTPTFFINGFRYKNKWDVESLLEALLQAENSCHHRA